MASLESKLSENIEGKFYVDDQCIACDACITEAPDFFIMSDKGYAFVKKQPANPDEEKNCYQAQDACPVDAIGDDGI